MNKAKKSSAKSRAPKECPPLVPPPTPPPPLGGGDDGNDGATTLDFVYFGEEDTAKGLNGGKLVQHSMPLDGESRTYVFSLRAGPHRLRTLAELTVTALLGPCVVAVQHETAKTLQTGQEMTMIPGSTFTLQTNAKAVLLITSLGDPGLGGGRGGGSIIEN